MKLVATAVRTLAIALGALSAVLVWKTENLIPVLTCFFSAFALGQIATLLREGR